MADPCDKTLVPSVCVPFRNITVPVTGGDTRAVNVTGLPNAEGFLLEVRVVFVAPTSVVAVAVDDNSDAPPVFFALIL